jgi:outer membrane protein assembly factor BamB
MPSVRSRRCPACDAPWAGTRARFCGRCGAPLPARTPATSTGRRRLLVTLVLLLAAIAGVGVALLAGPHASGQRADRRGDQGRVDLPPGGGAAATSPSAGGSLLGCEGCRGWRLAVADPLTSLAVTGRDVVVGTGGGTVLAVDGDTGERRWTAQVGDEAAHAVVLDEVVVVGTTGARVVALDRADGRTRWDVTVPIATAGARALAGDEDGVLLTGGSEPAVAALDGQTGTVRWTRMLPGRTVGVADTLVRLTPEGQLEGWRASADGPRWTDLARPDEQLVGRAGELVVTRAADGLRFREVTRGAVVATGPATVTWWAAADDGTLVLADTGARTQVVALDDDGDERWRVTLPGADTASGCCVEVAPTADGRVLAVDRRVAGRAAVLDLATGTVLSDVGRAAAAIPGWLLIGAHGDLGVLQGEGAVAGVDLASGEERWRTSDASVLVGLDPLVVSGRRHLLGPWAEPPS